MQPPASRRRRHLLRERGLFLGVVVLLGAYVVFLLVNSGGIPTPGRTGYDVDAVLPTAGAQLVGGARVTMAGVDVGHVTGVERKGAGAIVKMQLTDDEVAPLPQGTRAQLRSRTPLGENYISLVPGRERATLPAGSTLPIEQAVPSVDVDEVLSVLRGRDRTNARALLRGTGSALDGQGARLNALVGGAGGTVQHGAAVVAALYPQRQQLGQLADQLGLLAAGVGERDADLRRIATAGTTTLRAVAAQDGDVRRLLDVLPSTLGQVRRTTQTLGATSDVAAPVLDDLATTIVAARPAAAALAPGASELRGTLDALGAASPPLTRTLGALRKASGPATRTLPVLRRTLCQVDPVLRYTRPYVADLMGVITQLGSASSAYDAVGHTIRLAATINENSLVGLPADQVKAAQTLLHAGLLSKSNGATFIPFPGPREGNRTSSDYPAVSGPAEVKAKTGYVFPHVTADC